MIKMTYSVIAFPEEGITNSRAQSPASLAKL